MIKKISIPQWSDLIIVIGPSGVVAFSLFYISQRSRIF